MLRNMCKSKIHRARVTETNLNYEGSITIDKTLLLLADIHPLEKVHVVNVNNGSRAETYVIEGAENSGEICLNGALARYAEPDDLIIIISYAYYDRDELNDFVTKVVQVNHDNQAI